MVRVRAKSGNVEMEVTDYSCQNGNLAKGLVASTAEASTSAILDKKPLVSQTPSLLLLVRILGLMLHFQQPRIKDPLPFFYFANYSSLFCETPSNSILPIQLIPTGKPRSPVKNTFTSV